MSNASIETAGATRLGEAVPPGEAEALGRIVRAIEGRVREAARHGPARRDAHPKAHGCVRAEFRVLDTVPRALRAGVFAEPRRFDAWVRFSNGSERPRGDAEGDGRGMAIKLLGVAGSPSGTQDFLLVNHPVFFVRDAAEYVEFQTASPPWRFFAPSLNPFALRLREALIVRRIVGQDVRNPLSARYWSMAPYACGDLACKFSARPLRPSSPHRAAEGPNFLRANLARHLAEAEARFEFLVQPRTDAAAMSIEDPRIEWDEAAAPFVPVAVVTIPPQRFDTPERDAFGENLSFTPWHCLDAHRPLGGINRVRRTVYETISRLRHELNGAPREEPTAGAAAAVPSLTPAEE
jgi:Catalase